MEKKSIREQLIGTWKLTVLEDFVDNKWTKSFGEHPAGYFSFAADGRVSVQFQKDLSTLPKVDSKVNAETSAYNAYLAYFGTYTVDENAMTFTSLVEGALDQSLVATKQTRPFQIKGTQLIVGDQKTYRRFFEKISI